MTWATLTVDGTFTEHEGVPELEQMQEVVGGNVQVIGLKHGIDVWVNEEGHNIRLETNKRATMFAHEARSIVASDWLAGDVFFTGGVGPEGETLGLTAEQLEYVRQSERMSEMGFPGSGIWNMTGIQL